MRDLHLMHDVLDSQLVARGALKIGRADGLVALVRDGAPPRVAAILTGAAPRAERIASWYAHLVDAIRRWVGAAPLTDGTTRIDFSTVRAIGHVISLDTSAEGLSSMRRERWLADHLITRVPGGAAGRDPAKKGR